MKQTEEEKNVFEVTTFEEGIQVAIKLAEKEGRLVNIIVEDSKDEG